MHIVQFAFIEPCLTRETWLLAVGLAVWNWIVTQFIRILILVSILDYFFLQLSCFYAKYEFSLLMRHPSLNHPCSISSRLLAYQCDTRDTLMLCYVVSSVVIVVVLTSLSNYGDVPYGEYTSSQWHCGRTYEYYIEVKLD